MPPSKKTEPEVNLRRSSRSTRGSIKPIVDLTQVEISDDEEEEVKKEDSDDEVQLVESEESEEDFEVEEVDGEEVEDDIAEEEDVEDEDYDEKPRKSGRPSTSSSKSKRTKATKSSKKSSSAIAPDLEVIDICYELNEKEMRDINNAFDLNCSTDGEELMNAENLKTAMRAMGFEPRANEIQRLFEKFSKNNKINRDGFHKIMAFKLGSTPGEGDNILDDQLSRVFRMLDVDKTGLLTFENLKHVAKELEEEITDEELHEMIAEADLDGDSKINRQEFYNIMKKTSLY